jgi:heptosyltransferase II
VRRILVIRLSSLGDVVLTLPVFQRLRELFPKAHLTALTKDAFADVLRGNPAVDEVITLSQGELLLSVARRVRRSHYDAVVDLHANLRSRVITAASGATFKTRYRKAALARRLYVRWRWPSQDLERHTLERYLEAAERLAVRGAAPRSVWPPLARPPQAILVVQTAFLGDAVLTTPLLTALRERFPQATLSVLCTPETAEVFRRHPGLTDLLVFDKRGAQKSVADRLKLIRQVRSKSFDLAVIPHRSITSALIARLAGIRERVGFASSQGRRLMTRTVPFEWGVHDVDRNMALLKALGVAPPPAVLRMSADPEAQKAVQGRLAEAGVRSADRLVGLHAGSVWATKRWLPEGFAAVADGLAQRMGARVVFVGGGKDKPLIGEILGRMKTQALNWVGETDLRELIAVIARCQAFLTNDSGPMHIAVACGIPTVAIFGPTTRELGFFPYGEGHQVIEKALPCRPCGLHGADRCPLGHFQCMRSITPEEVLAAMGGALQRSGRMAPVS